MSTACYMPLIFFVWIFAAGCAITPHPTPPYAPVTPRASEDVAGHNTIKEIFDDTLTLKRAIKIAHQNNPSLEATRFAVAKARAVGRIAHARRMPQLYANSTAGRYSESQRIMPASYNGDPGGFSKNLAAAELAVSCPLYTGGSFKAQADAARFSIHASHLRSQRAFQEIEYNVSMIYYHALAQDKFIDALVFNRTALASHLKHINNMVVAQKAAKVELLRVEVRVAELVEQLAQSRSRLAISMQMLATLMGLESADFKLSDHLQEPLDNPVDEEDLQSLLASASQSRNDLAAMREGLQAQAKSVDAARGERLPNLSAFAAYGGRWGIDSDDSMAGADDSGDIGRVGVYLTFPIWDGNLIQAKIDSERAELGRLQKEFETMKLQVTLEVKTAFLNLNSSMERFRASKKGVEQAAEVLRIQDETYRLGKLTLTDYLDSQTAILNAQTNYYLALAEYQTFKSQLALAVGKTGSSLQ